MQKVFYSFYSTLKNSIQTSFEAGSGYKKVENHSGNPKIKVTIYVEDINSFSFQLGLSNIVQVDYE